MTSLNEKEKWYIKEFNDIYSKPDCGVTMCTEMPCYQSKIVELLHKVAQKTKKEQREEMADQLKHKFNGFAGKLGFTLNELLTLINNKEETQ